MNAHVNNAMERPALAKVAELHPTLNLGAFVEATRTVPDTAIALIDLTGAAPETITYAGLELEIQTYVGAFRAIGVKRGTRFALALPNCRLFLTAFLALMRLGAIPVFINSHLTMDAVQHIVVDSGSQGLLADLEDVPGLAALASLPSLRWSLSRSGAASDSWTSWPDIVGAARPDATIETMGFDDQAFQPYTAGSTGMPKGIVLTHGGMLWGIEHSFLYWPPVNERGIVAAPMFHKNAMRGVIKPMLRGGASVVILPGFEPRQYIETISKYRVTSCGGVPAMYADIMREEDLIRSLDFSALRLLSMGSATVPAELSTRLAKAFPHAGVKESYGMTEVGGPTRPHSNGMPTPVGSVGVIAPEYEAKLVDDAGNLSDVAGELHLRSPYVLKAYAGLPELTAARIYDGWLRTGDKFRRDENGFLYFVGRSDDMFSCGGENIYPKEVENLILKHPDVSDVIVVPLPHETKSFAPTALVLPVPGRSVEPKTIQDFCAANGPAFAVPRAILIVADIPRTSAGKPDRKAAQALMSGKFGTLKSRSRKG